MNKGKQIKKEMIINDLALMVARGFDEMGGRIGKIDGKMDKMKLELKKEIKESIKESEENIKAEINKKVDKIEYNTLEYRVEKIEKKFA